MGQYDRVTYEGKLMTRRQRQAIKHVSKISEERYNLAIHCYQGSWRPYTSYSGTTHTDAGVVDLYVYGMSTMDKDKLHSITRLLRREGCQAAFLRGPFVDMPWHWHVNDLDTTHMDFNAQWQVSEYRKGNDGLVAGRNDPFPYRPKPIKKWDFKA
jgi:hypothetical protein